jgi:uncharacterized protein (DUF2062 family)
MTHLDLWDIKEQFLAVLQMGREVLIPLLIGSVAIGLVTGFLTYVFSLKLLSIFLTRRAKKHVLDNRKPK